MNKKFKIIWRILSTIAILAVIAGITSCEKYTYPAPTVDPNTTWSFSKDIQPIFNANCISCHGGNRSPDLRAGKSYLALTKGGFVSLPAETSRLFVQMNSSSHISRSSETDRLKVKYWITQGALNN
jgi:hypothetical protein